MNSFVFGALTILGCLRFSQQLLTIEKTVKKTALVDCICKFAILSKALKLAAWYYESENDLISDIVEKLEIPIVLNAQETSRSEGLETRIPSSLVVILNQMDIEYVLNQTLWNVNTRFFLVGRNTNELLENFSFFWKYRVVNAFGLVESEENSGRILIYGFFPYSYEECRVGTMLSIDKYDEASGKFENGAVKLIDLIKIRNMFGCPINVTIVHVQPITIFTDESGQNSSSRLEGIEGKLLHEVARRFNFKPTFKTSTDGVGWGWIRPSPRGAVGEVFTGVSDFANGLLAPTIERYEALDLSIPYGGKECITYGVPNGAGVRTPTWITILVFEFTPVTWFLLLLSFIFTFYVFHGMNKYMKKTWFKKKSDIFLYELSSMLGMPINIPEHLYARLIVLTWIIFSFIATLFYKTSISSRLTVPSEDPDIDTFEELLQSRLQLTGYSNMLRLLQNGSDPLIRKMETRFKVTDYDINHALDLIAQERNIAYMRHTSTFLYYSLINPISKGNIHVMTDCVLSYYPIVATKKNSPFTRRLNQLISRLRESGITQRWRSEYIYHVPPTPKLYHELTVYHMYGVFSILLGGCLLSLVLFLAEIAVFRSKPIRQRR